MDCSNGDEKVQRENEKVDTPTGSHYDATGGNRDKTKSSELEAPPCLQQTSGSIVEDYLSPKEIDRVVLERPFHKWKDISKVMNGPICWKCFNWGPFFRCEKCGRYYHRECVFMKPGFPCPMFDKSLDEAIRAEWGEVNLLTCANCLISEETRISELRDASQIDLNQALNLLTKLIKTEFAGSLLEKHFPCPDLNGPTVDKIIEKAARNEYKTVEAYYGDFRMIMYNIIKAYSYNSEATDVAKSIMYSVGKQLSGMIACLECTLRRFNPDGKLWKVKEFMSFNRIPCKKPHVLLWVRQGLSTYWPAKLLAYDRVKKFLYIQKFQERATIHELSFPCTELDVKIYSGEYPGIKPKETDKCVRTWRAAKTDAKKYIENLQNLFGEPGVVIPKHAEVFDGDVDAAVKRMFPLYCVKESVQDDTVMV